MLFNSIVFLIFFISFYVAYLLIRKREARVSLIVLGSYIFYGWWDWRFLSLILFSTVFDFIIGARIFQEQSEDRKKRLLYLSLFSNLGLLFFFKYFNFFIDSFVEVASVMGLSPSVHTLHIILPVGISFYTFQTLSYTIDIYKGKLKPEPHFMIFASYVAFFPQLVAGPIVRAIDLLPQFKVDHRMTSRQIWSGLFLITLGYFKKLVVADSLAPLIDNAFANPDAYTSLNMAIVVVFYSFQIYCDFSGYSDIAIGLGRLLGYDFPTNFNLPYLSKNFSDFWRRWHISLSSWLRDYLYIPLGGNRGGSVFTMRNLMITMLLGGLWHGANWTFVVWGFLHGLFLALQRLLGPVIAIVGRQVHRSLMTLMGMILTFSLVTIAWIFFRSQSIEGAVSIIEKIFAFDNMSFSAVKPKFQILKAALVIGLLFSGELVYYCFKSSIDVIMERREILRLYLIACMGWLIFMFGTFTSSNFIYFQF